MVDHSRTALVGALGGTYVSLAVADIDELTISHFALLNSVDFESPTQAIERYLKSLPTVPNKAALSVAGSVRGDHVVMDHLPWNFTKKEIRAATGCEHVCFVNEFEGLALALPSLSRYELIEIVVGERVLNGTRLVVASGSGFGAAALRSTKDFRVAVAGPIRHASLALPAAQGLDPEKIYAGGADIVAEDVYSGRGLLSLYRAVAERDGLVATLQTPPAITRAALADEDAAALEATRLTCNWLAGYAGDLALTFGARGGVYLGGGLLSNVVPLLKAPEFREAFLGKGARREYLSAIDVHVIKTAADAGLRGAAIALAQSLPARPVRVTMRA